jgi:dipeptidyl aminopeptidase/acylaminoacyl peptidase
VREIEYSQAAGQSLRLDVSVPDGAGPFPVAVLMHGTEDKSVPYAQSVRFQAELRKNGVECGLATIQRASHKLQAWRSLDREYPSRLLDWLHRTIPNR